MQLAEPRTAAVPFLDLGAIHAPLAPAILEEIAELIRSSAFTNGPQVAEFERAFAAFCGTKRCVGLASGLDALRLALLAGGLEPGDEVIVPANTFIATLEAVTQAGGTPVIADVGESDYNLDVAALEAAVTPRTRYVLPVHLYGQLADLRAILPAAGRSGIGVLEDACQAHGARRDGITPGTLSLAAAFSFYPGKNLGAMGDAGALVTRDDRLADDVTALREHGQRRKYRHELIGWTARLDTIQAIVLSHKLRCLDAWNEERRAVARAYGERLAGLGDLVLPPVPEGSEPVWHLYVVRTADPVALADHLRSRGIDSGFHYPEPVHRSRAYRSLGYREGAFPVAERLARETLSLPVFPGLTAAQVEAVVAGVRSFFDRG